MFEYFHIDDLYKALIALGAGVVLGLERELKDKAAGLRTITLITLGSALFAIVSYRMGQPNQEATRIASYIVSGIGFLGAGVIFKDGVTVSGLTTASVIWVSSAVGMSIGFGQAYLAFIFLVTAFLVIHFGSIINRIVPSYKRTRMLMICLAKEQAHLRNTLVAKMKSALLKVDEIKLAAKGDKVYVYYDITIRKGKLSIFENFLLEEETILEFEL
ncbi:MgtC/SapB family protein [Niabella digestorum]|uniref:MgtC/SapB family protein n=1 Tax=Niabella digestorum TaxID=3117701 RepID=A0ABU7RE22_9BACT